MGQGRRSRRSGVNSAMRHAIAALCLFALGACSPASNSDAATNEERTSATVLTGDYKASSNTARSITGGMVVQRAGVTFTNGITLYTRTLNPRRGGDLMAKNGDSYAAAVVGPGDLNVELGSGKLKIVDGEKMRAPTDAEANALAVASA